MRYDIPAPMLAKAVKDVPDAAGWSFEPKWDGFRVLAAWDGESVELGIARREAAHPVLPRTGRGAAARAAGAVSHRW